MLLFLEISGALRLELAEALLILVSSSIQAESNRRIMVIAWKMTSSCSNWSVSRTADVPWGPKRAIEEGEGVGQEELDDEEEEEEEDEEDDDEDEVSVASKSVVKVEEPDEDEEEEPDEDDDDEEAV
jgi:hypothetical protein